MIRKLNLLALAFAILALPCQLPGQTSLSQNSGINASDTWITADITVATTGSATFSSPIYIPSEQASSKTVPANPPTHSMHVEAGYDASGGLVMNIWPKAAINPSNTDANPFGVIRFAGGQLTVFDENGNPLPVTPLSAAMSLAGPLSLLGSNPGPSVVGGRWVPNIQAHATAMAASLSIAGSSPQTATLAMPFAKGGNAQWTYVASGSNWVAQQVVLTPALSNATASLAMQFANVAWSDNVTNDSARASKASTGQTPPAVVTTAPASLTTLMADPATVAAGQIITPPNCNSNTYNLGGAQNVVFMHGIFSTSCTWTRMANWLNQDFRFSTEMIPTIATANGIASQGATLANDITAQGGGGYLLVGHSQGGLAARYAAQSFYQRGAGNTIAGVVTVDTPHEGANAAGALPTLTTVGFAALSQELWVSIGCVTDFDNPGCYLSALLITASAVGSNVAWNSLSQSLTDLAPTASSSTLSTACRNSFQGRRWSATPTSTSQSPDG
jgi:pimeloyl-ACP methyl ester carboxylesterase